MKKIILGALLLLSTLSFGQTNKTKTKAKTLVKTCIINGILNTKLENGLGTKVPTTFSVSKPVLDSINNSNQFKKFKTELDLPENKDYKTSINKSIPLVEEYLLHKIEFANLWIKMTFKNSNSYSVTPNSKGSVYMDGDKLVIFLHTQGQNGYGNTILNDNYFIYNLSTGEQKVL